MKTSHTGNGKLGKKVVVVSRPVGLSCPSSCPFLDTVCYAQGTEKQFPNSRKAGMANMAVTTNQIRTELEFAERNGKSVRIHERGDFCRNDKLDMPYVRAWSQALKTVKTKVWAYTHYYTKMLAKMPNVSMYASVHNAQDIKKAKQAGFTLFAFCSKIKGKNGGNADAPKFIDVPGLGKTLVCPEQRLGRKRVTCDKCRWCVEGKGNVAFLEH
jgi:hypothetical protein